MMACVAMSYVKVQRTRKKFVELNTSVTTMFCATMSCVTVQVTRNK